MSYGKDHVYKVQRDEARAEVERLKRYECSWTECGAQKKNRELQAEVERLRTELTKYHQLKSELDDAESNDV